MGVKLGYMTFLNVARCTYQPNFSLNGLKLEKLCWGPVVGVRRVELGDRSKDSVFLV